MTRAGRVPLATAVALVTVLTACNGGGDGGRAAPSSSPAAQTTPPVVDDVELVRQAVEATRKRGTAAFTVLGTVTMTEGELTMRRQGHYDLGTGTASLRQTFESAPPELVEEMLGEEGGAAKAEARSVVTGAAVYLQMPAWPSRIRSKWLRFETNRLDRDSRRAGVAVSGEVFPAMLEMLAKAKVSPQDRSGRSRVPVYATVLVPPAEAFLAFPSTTIRKMVEAGADPEKLDGDVEVTVEIDNGLVVTVTYDAKELIDQAFSQIGRGGAGGQFSGFGATLHLSDHGKPVTIAVPPAGAVMTDEEFEAAF